MAGKKRKENIFIDGMLRRRCVICDCVITLENCKLEHNSPMKCCSDCYSEYNRQIYLRNKIKDSSFIRKINLRKNHDITLEQFNKMVEIQNNMCAICKKENGRGKGLHIDHNHETNKIRGLLCFKCNSLLGMCDENLEILDAAMDYIVKYRDMEKEFGQVNEFDVEGYIQNTQE